MKRILFLVLVGVFLCAGSASAGPILDNFAISYELRRWDPVFTGKSDISHMLLWGNLSGDGFDPNATSITVNSIPTGQDYRLPLDPSIWIPNCYEVFLPVTTTFSDWETHYSFGVTGFPDIYEEVTVPSGSFRSVDFAEASYDATTGIVSWGHVDNIDSYAVRIFNLLNGEVDFRTKLFDSGNILTTEYQLTDLNLDPGNYVIAVEARDFTLGTMNRSRYYTPLTIDANPVPEPTKMLLFGTGLLGLAGIRRKKSEKV